MGKHVDFELPISQQFGLICFRISGDAIGQCVSCVSATSVEAARARLEPLFRGCEFTPLSEHSYTKQ